MRSGDVVPGRIVLYGTGRADTATITGRLLRLVKGDGRLVLLAPEGVQLAVVPLPAHEVSSQVEVVRDSASRRDLLIVTGSSTQRILRIKAPWPSRALKRGMVEEQAW